MNFVDLKRITELRSFLKKFIASEIKKLGSFAAKKISPEKAGLLYSDGKMVRSKLFFYLCDALISEEGKKSKVVAKNQMYLAAGIELIHLASLVHDDVIDQDGVRRGNATMNASFGNKIAVILGDFLFSKCLEMLSSGVELDSRRKNAILGEVFRVVSNLSFGELSQSLRDSKPSYSELIKIASMKTGSLFELPCVFACILHSFSAKSIKMARECGRDVGIAFQINDDNQDFLTRKTDWATHSNATLQDMTVPIVVASKSSFKNRGLFKRVFKPSKITRKRDLDRVLETMQSPKVQEKISKEIKHYLQDAVKALDSIVKIEGLGEFLETFFI